MPDLGREGRQRPLINHRKEKIMSNRQYVACTFRPGDVRSYTYHFDGEPLVVGDRCVVSSDRGQQVVTVVKLVADPPSFVTKAIAGKKRVPADAPVDGDDRDLEAHLGDRA
jgi:hypothetical protein